MIAAVQCRSACARTDPGLGLDRQRGLPVCRPIDPAFASIGSCHSEVHDRHLGPFLWADQVAFCSAYPSFILSFSDFIR